MTERQIDAAIVTTAARQMTAGEPGADFLRAGRWRADARIAGLRCRVPLWQISSVAVRFQPYLSRRADRHRPGCFARLANNLRARWLRRRHSRSCGLEPAPSFNVRLKPDATQRAEARAPLVRLPPSPWRLTGGPRRSTLLVRLTPDAACDLEPLEHGRRSTWTRCHCR